MSFTAIAWRTFRNASVRYFALTVILFFAVLSKDQVGKSSAAVDSKVNLLFPQLIVIFSFEFDTFTVPSISLLMSYSFFAGIVVSPVVATTIPSPQSTVLVISTLRSVAVIVNLSSLIFTRILFKIGSVPRFSTAG